jgi:hypothetical protein
MTAEIIEQIRPEMKTSIDGRITFYNIYALEKALLSDRDFMDLFRSCEFDWPGEIVPISALAYWLLEEAERSGDAEASLAKLNEFMAAPRRTWQLAIVCTDVRAQHKGVKEGWVFCNGVTAYAAGLSDDYTILSDDKLITNGIILLDQREGAEIADFTMRATDCCRALSFVAGEGFFIRPTYITYVYETSAPYPVGDLPPKDPSF